MHLKEELEKRGLLYQHSHDEVFDLYDQGGQKFYCGYDPTADSLTVGHLVSIMNHVQYMKRGNTFYLLLGGATGMIGDPSGKDAERNFLDQKTLLHNISCIAQQMERLVANLERKAGVDLDFKVVNNADFYQGMSFLDFLRHVGKYITVNTMMNKETVKKRITDPDKSISYTEFSYMLIQGYDFVHLYEQEGVKLQTCGSDQRGNCVTGLELIDKKLDRNDAFVASHILLTDANGKKFGKSEGNALRFDESKNSPYQVYQYFLNTQDDDVERFLKILTLLDLTEIDDIVAQHYEHPARRYGQHRLAEYVVSVMFDDTKAQQAKKISDLLFGQEDTITTLSSMNDQEIQALMQEIGGCEVSEFFPIVDICVQSNLTSSKSEARKMIKQGAVSLNGQKIHDGERLLSDQDFANGKCLLKKGKKKYRVVRKG